MALYFDYEFEAELVEHDVGSGRYNYIVVWVPDALSQRLPLKEYPRLRITGEAEDCPIESSLTPVRGRWYILFSKAKLEAMGKALGDTVHIRFAIADQDAVDVPEALAAALSEDRELSALWEAQTAGMKRSIAYLVGSAKREATIAKRLVHARQVMAGTHDLKGNQL